MTIKSAAEDKPFIATLKRGETYVLGVNPETTIRFLKGVDTPVDQDIVTILREKAVDMIDTGDEDDDGVPQLEAKCKFDIRKFGEEAKQPPRRRIRAG